MNDFISLTCPACGGELTVKEGSEFYTCEYCGRYHKIRPEDIEFYAKCPLCQRNDKVDKLTAINQRQRGSFISLTPPEHPDQLFPYNPKHKPRPPSTYNIHQKPQKNPDIIKKSIGTALGSIVLFAMFITLLILVGQQEDIGSKLCVGAGFLILIPLIKPMVSQMQELRSLQESWTLANKKYQEGQEKIANNKRNYDKELSSWETYKEKYDYEHKQKKSEMMKIYNQVMTRFNKIYYCHRDDCVFIPGQKDFAQSTEIKDYIWGEYIKYI